MGITANKAITITIDRRMDSARFLVLFISLSPKIEDSSRHSLGYKLAAIPSFTHENRPMQHFIYKSQ